MLFVKYSTDREKLMEIVKTNRGRFEKMEKRAADVIEAVTGFGMKYEKEEETVNVCKAIRELKEEAYNEGRKDAMKELKEEVYNEGEKNGYQQGKLETVRNFYKKGIGIDVIATCVEATPQTVRQWLGLADA